MQVETINFSLKLRIINDALFMQHIFIQKTFPHKNLKCFFLLALSLLNMLAIH